LCFFYEENREKNLCTTTKKYLLAVLLFSRHILGTMRVLPPAVLKNIVEIDMIYLCSLTMNRRYNFVAGY